MKEYLQNFTDETRLTLESLEVNLLSFEQDPENIEMATSVFREMHSIKGAAGMFGFSDISKLTHAAENIFSDILKDKIEPSAKIINICFSLVDFVRESLDRKSVKEELAEKKEQLFSQIGEIIDISEIIAVKVAEEQSLHNTFYVKFHPDSDFEQRGVNLFEILDEAEKQGKAVKFEKPALPNPEDSIEKFYMFWEFIIGGKLSSEDLNEVFLFVEGETQITKISEQDLFQDKNFESSLEFIENDSLSVDIEVLKTHILPFEKVIEPVEVKPAELAVDNTKKTYSSSEYKTASINVSSHKLDELMNAVSELITVKETLRLIASETNSDELNEVADSLEKISRNIQDNSLDMRLVPLRSIMVKFERLVRELSIKLDKELIFETDGADTELDKEIVDSLTDSLMHIFRNSIDHGIEMPDEREAKGKSRKGRIKFFASYSGNNVIIQIHDDGKGIDPQKIRKKAIAKKIMSETDVLTDHQLLNLIFLPGFSTAKKVTAVSGRGVGLDVVRQKVAALHGESEVNSEIDLGTYFTIKVPLTLSIVDTLHIIINGENFLMPKYVVSSVGEISEAKLESITNNTIVENGMITPFINLKEKFGSNKTKSLHYNVIYVNYKDGIFGLVIDDIVGNHQAVLKPLGTMLNSQLNFSGASILGSGALALMIDADKVIKNYT